MDWLKLELCAIIWVLCVSKSYSQAFTNTEPVCTQGQSIPSPDKCNQCICFEGQIHCTHIVCPSNDTATDQECQSNADISQTDSCNVCMCIKGQIACTNLICIPAPQCVNGKQYPPPNKCNTCTCQNGVIVCTNNYCDAVENRFGNSNVTCVEGQNFQSTISCIECGCVDNLIKCWNTCARSGPECYEGQPAYKPDECNECYCVGGKFECSDLICIRGSQCSAGEVIPKPDNCNSCTCVDGHVLCTNHQCPKTVSKNAFIPETTAEPIGVLPLNYECQDGDVIPPLPPPDDCNECMCFENTIICTQKNCLEEIPDINGIFKVENEQKYVEDFDKKISMEPFINMLLKNYHKIPTKLIHTHAYNGFHQEIKVHSKILPKDTSQLLKALASSLDNPALAGIGDKLSSSPDLLLNNHGPKTSIVLHAEQNSPEIQLIEGDVLPKKKLESSEINLSQSSKLITSGSQSNETILVVPNMSSHDIPTTQSVMPLINKYETYWTSVASPAPIIIYKYTHQNEPSVVSSTEQDKVVRNPKFGRPGQHNTYPSGPSRNTENKSQNVQKPVPPINPTPTNNNMIANALFSQDDKQYKPIPPNIVFQHDELRPVWPYHITEPVNHYIADVKSSYPIPNLGQEQQFNRTTLPPNQYHPSESRFKQKPPHYKFGPKPTVDNSNPLFPPQNGQSQHKPDLAIAHSSLVTHKNSPHSQSNIDPAISYTYQYKSPEIRLKPGQEQLNPHSTISYTQTVEYRPPETVLELDQDIHPNEDYQYNKTHSYYETHSTITDNNEFDPPPVDVSSENNHLIQSKWKSDHDSNYAPRNETIFKPFKNRTININPDNVKIRNYLSSHSKKKRPRPNPNEQQNKSLQGQSKISDENQYSSLVPSTSKPTQSDEDVFKNKVNNYLSAHPNQRPRETLQDQSKTLEHNQSKPGKPWAYQYDPSQTAQNDQPHLSAQTYQRPREKDQDPYKTSDNNESKPRRPWANQFDPSQTAQYDQPHLSAQFNQRPREKNQDPSKTSEYNPSKPRKPWANQYDSSQTAQNDQPHLSAPFNQRPREKNQDPSKTLEYQSNQSKPRIPWADQYDPSQTAQNDQPHLLVQSNQRPREKDQDLSKTSEYNHSKPRRPWANQYDPSKNDQPHLSAQSNQRPREKNQDEFKTSEYNQSKARRPWANHSDPSQTVQSDQPHLSAQFNQRPREKNQDPSKTLEYQSNQSKPRIPWADQYDPSQTAQNDQPHLLVQSNQRPREKDQDLSKTSEYNHSKPRRPWANQYDPSKNDQPHLSAQSNQRPREKNQDEFKTSEYNQSKARRPWANHSDPSQTVQNDQPHLSAQFNQRPREKNQDQSKTLEYNQYKPSKPWANQYDPSQTAQNDQPHLSAQSNQRPGEKDQDSSKTSGYNKSKPPKPWANQYAPSQNDQPHLSAQFNQRPREKNQDESKTSEYDQSNPRGLSDNQYDLSQTRPHRIPLNRTIYNNPDNIYYKREQERFKNKIEHYLSSHSKQKRPPPNPNERQNKTLQGQSKISEHNQEPGSVVKNDFKSYPKIRITTSTRRPKIKDYHVNSKFNLLQDQLNQGVFDDRGSDNGFQYISNSAEDIAKVIPFQLQQEDALIVNQFKLTQTQFKPFQNKPWPGPYDERGSAVGYPYISNSAEDPTKLNQYKPTHEDPSKKIPHYQFNPSQNSHLTGPFDHRGSADGFQYILNSAEDPIKVNQHKLSHEDPSTVNQFKLPHYQFNPSQNKLLPGAFDDHGSADKFLYIPNSVEDLTKVNKQKLPQEDPSKVNQFKLPHYQFNPSQNKPLLKPFEERGSADGFQYISYSAEDSSILKVNTLKPSYSQLTVPQSQPKPGLFDDGKFADGYSPDSTDPNELNVLPSLFKSSVNLLKPIEDRGSADGFQYISNSFEDPTKVNQLKQSHSPFKSSKNRPLSGAFGEASDPSITKVDQFKKTNSQLPQDQQNPGSFDDRGSADGFQYKSNSGEDPTTPNINPFTPLQPQFKVPQVQPWSVDDREDPSIVHYKPSVKKSSILHNYYYKPGQSRFGPNQNQSEQLTNSRPQIKSDDQNDVSSTDVNSIRWSLPGDHNTLSNYNKGTSSPQSIDKIFNGNLPILTTDNIDALDAVNTTPLFRLKPEQDQYSPSSVDNIFNGFHQIPWFALEGNVNASDKNSSTVKPDQVKYELSPAKNLAWPKINNADKNKLKPDQEKSTLTTELLESDSNELHYLFKPDGENDTPLTDSKHPNYGDQYDPANVIVPKKQRKPPPMDNPKFAVGATEVEFDNLPYLFPGIFKNKPLPDDDQIKPSDMSKTKHQQLPINYNSIRHWLTSDNNLIPTLYNGTVTIGPPSNKLKSKYVIDEATTKTMDLISKFKALPQKNLQTRIQDPYTESMNKIKKTPGFMDVTTVPKDSRNQPSAVRYPDVHIIIHNAGDDMIPHLIENGGMSPVTEEPIERIVGLFLPRMLHPRFRYRPKDQKEECGEGTEWISNCHGCSCYGGQAICFQIPDCHLRPFGEPMICKPYSHFKMGACYSCECNGDGVAECDATDCGKTEPNDEQEQVKDSNGLALPVFNEFFDEKKTYEILEYYRVYKKLPKDCTSKTLYPTCEVGTSWSSSCQKCQCNEKGQHECTLIKDCKLDYESHGTPGRCKPNSKFYPKTTNMPCVECTCDDEGNPYCPRIEQKKQ